MKGVILILSLVPLIGFGQYKHHKTIYDYIYIIPMICENLDEVVFDISEQDYISGVPYTRNSIMIENSNVIQRRRFYESGKLHSIGYYKFHPEKCTGWVPVYNCLYFSEEGFLNKEEVFEDGKLIKTITY